MIKGSTAWTLDAEALRRLVYESGLRQVDIADAVGVGVSAVNQWMSGKRKRPAPSDVRKLARKLSESLGRPIDVTELLIDPTGEPEPASVSA